MIIEVLAATAAFATAQPQERIAPRGDYRETCSGAYTNQGRLYADCRDNRGQVRGASIELNRCSDYTIRNDNGLLVCGPIRGSYEDRPGNGGGWGGGNGGGWGGGRNEITVYRDSYYRGPSQSFNGEVRDLGRGGMNDAISSMQFRGEWTFCTDANFRGQCQTLRDGAEDLTRVSGLNDRISSFAPGRVGGGNPGGPGGGWGGGRDGSITIFRDTNFRGEQMTFEREVPDLQHIGMNDATSSIQLRGEWEVCTDSYFRGQCRVINNDVLSLVPMGFNDRISSMRPIRRR